MPRNHPLGQECPLDLNDRRIARLEAALQSIAGKDHVTDSDYCAYSAGDQGYPAKPCICAVGVAKDALSGGTSALDAAVASAVAAERARIRADAKARIVRLRLRGKMILADVLDAIDAAGGAP